MKKILRLGLKQLLVFLFLIAIFSPLVVTAADADILNNLKDTASAAGMNNSSNDLPTIIGSVIKALLSILGIIFLLLIIYGGVIWMTAAGDEGKVTKAKALITQSVIGLIIIMASYAIAYWVTKSIVCASGGAC